MPSSCLTLDDLKPAGVYAQVSASSPLEVVSHQDGRFGVAFKVPFYRGETAVALEISINSLDPQAVLTLEAHGFVSRFQKIRAKVNASGEILYRGDELSQLRCDVRDDKLVVRLSFTPHTSRHADFFVFCDSGADSFVVHDMTYEYPVPPNGRLAPKEHEIHFAVSDVLILRNYLQIDFELLKAGAELVSIDLEAPLDIAATQWFTGRQLSQHSEGDSKPRGQPESPSESQPGLQPKLAFDPLPSPVAIEKFGIQYADHGHSLRILLADFQDMRYVDAAASDQLLEDIRIVARFSDGSVERLPVQLREDLGPSHRALEIIHALADKPGSQPRFLELGGRGERSEKIRHTIPKNYAYSAIDIEPGPNVDVVGDIHKLSQLFPQEHFDVIFSHSVLEHLVAPWQVIVESNKVLKVGGYFIAYVPTTWPLHAEPWDFWRMSSNAWPGLLNERTGFEICEVQERGKAHIVPSDLSMYGASRMQHDPAPLFTSVIARKTGLASVNWHQEVIQFAKGHYDWE